MIKKLQRKFILLATAAVVLLLVAALGTVNLVNFWKARDEAMEVLDSIADNGGVLPDIAGNHELRRFYDAEPEIVFQTPVSAVIDGHAGMGQLIGHRAMTLAIEKAQAAGIGMVSVRNSNHYGIAGYYARMACERGLIGMSCTNSAAIMVPTFGRKAMLGSDPIAVAVPADPYAFIFDASTTVVTRGKLEMYNKEGRPLPEGWAVGGDGRPSTDAADVLACITAKQGGGILPLGGSTEKTGSHKGYGNAMICEIL